MNPHDTEPEVLIKIRNSNKVSEIREGLQRFQKSINKINTSINKLGEVSNLPVAIGELEKMEETISMIRQYLQEIPEKK